MMAETGTVGDTPPNTMSRELTTYFRDEIKMLIHIDRGKWRLRTPDDTDACNYTHPEHGNDNTVKKLNFKNNDINVIIKDLGGMVIPKEEADDNDEKQ
jgi:hypothetical protein